MNKLNLLCVSDVSLVSVMGGAERVLLEQATRLSQRGHGVHVITRRTPLHRRASETINGVHEIRCPFHATNPARQIMETWPEARRQFIALHERVKLGCLNIHQPITAYGLLQAAIGRNVPIVYTCHSLAFEEYWSRNPAGALWRRPVRWMNAMARRWIERSVLKHCCRVIALSDYTVEKLRRAYAIRRDRIEMIPGGVDLEKFHPVENKAPLRKRLGLPLEAFVLITVRNLEHRMGLDRLVEAMRIVVQRIPDSFLLVGGEGPLESRLREQVRQSSIAEHVRLTGFIPEEDLPAYYQAADLFILPSQELEGFGMVTLEAMACGLPVVGTPVGGTREILGGFDKRFLAGGCSAREIAEGIISYHEATAGSRSRAHRVAKNCRRYVEVHYSWDRNISILEKVFEQATRRHLTAPATEPSVMTGN